MGVASPPHWDQELSRIEAHVRHFVSHHKATAVVGVAVDDVAKRDYFAPRLQAMLDAHSWARFLTLRVVPMDGGEALDIHATPRDSPADPERRA